MCEVSFWIFFIWVCLIISITLGLVLRQFRFSLRVFKLSSRFFLHDYVEAVRFYRFAFIRFTFCRGSLDSFFLKEINVGTLDIVMAILMLLRNSKTLLENGEQGKGNRKQGTGNRERRTGNRERRKENKERGTGNRKQGGEVEKGEKGTGSRW